MYSPCLLRILVGRLLPYTLGSSPGADADVATLPGPRSRRRVRLDAIQVVAPLAGSRVTRVLGLALLDNPGYKNYPAIAWDGLRIPRRVGSTDCALAAEVL